MQIKEIEPFSLYLHDLWKTEKTWKNIQKGQFYYESQETDGRKTDVIFG